MGFTHYIKNKKTFSDTEWTLFCDDVKKLLSEATVPVANAHGTEGTNPVICSDYIAFNGVGVESHETAMIEKKSRDFDFCKTNQKPYDSLVVELYKLVRKYDPDVQLSSDGGPGVFDEEFKSRQVKKKFRLIFDVEIDLCGVNEETICENLRAIAYDALSNGEVTGDTEAIVQGHRCFVEEIS